MEDKIIGYPCLLLSFLYDIKVFEEDEEKEIIDGITEKQSIAVKSVLKRHGIKFVEIEHPPKLNYRQK